MTFKLLFSLQNDATSWMIALKTWLVLVKGILQKTERMDIYLGTAKKKTEHELKWLNVLFNIFIKPMSTYF